MLGSPVDGAMARQMIQFGKIWSILLREKKSYAYLVARTS
jgi:hypothetical protein